MDPFPCNNPQLSMMASFDDLIRAHRAIYESMDENFDGPIALAYDYEEMRKQYVLAKEVIIKRDDEIAQLKKNVRLLNLHLATVRQAYTRELKKKDNLQKDYNMLRKKLVAVQELLNEDRGGRSSPDSVLSILDEIKSLHGLPDVADESKESDDGLLFDKSEDSFDDDHHKTEIKMRKIDSESTQMNCAFRVPVSPRKSQSSNHLGLTTRIEPVVANNINSNNNNALERISEEDVNFGKSELNVAFISNGTPPPNTPVNSYANMPPCKSAVSLSRQKSDNYMFKLNRIRQGFKLEADRLDSRPHKFLHKKAFQPSIICGPCGKKIGFCSTYVVCNDCRGICHASERCQNQLPKPCIPYKATDAGLKKMKSSAQVGHIIMLADFTSDNSRPCVPALLVHCCNELDRRVANPKSAIDSDSVRGLYRINAIEKEVRELRARMLDGKSGIPNLGNTDSHLICGVVKTFLRDLDDPVVTRIMWNDFVRAAEHVQQFTESEGGLTDSDYESHLDEDNFDSSNEEWNESIRILKGVIVQLPNANRDSLSFLFLHFRRLLDHYSLVQMDIESLSRIFAPTIVGSARPQTGTLRMSAAGDARRENEKQIMVMKALFKLSRHFWDGLLKDPNYCPFEPPKENPNYRKSLNTSIIQKRSTTNVRTLIDGSKPRDPIY